MPCTSWKAAPALQVSPTPGPINRTGEGRLTDDRSILGVEGDLFVKVHTASYHVSGGAVGVAIRLSLSAVVICGAAIAVITPRTFVPPYHVVEGCMFFAKADADNPMRT